MTRILIAAPYASLRAGLEVLLTEEDCMVVGAAGSGAELEILLHEAAPDVVLMDWAEEQHEFGRLLGLLAGAEVGLVLLGEEPADMQRLLASDVPAWACLRRETEGAELAVALRAVAAGLVVMDRALVRHLRTDTESPGLSLPRSTPSIGLEPLTARERQVIQLMAQGLANKQIAGRLAISLHTVKFHVASILSKLGATSRTEAVTQGARNGLVTL